MDRAVSDWARDCAVMDWIATDWAATDRAATDPAPLRRIGLRRIGLRWIGLRKVHWMTMTELRTRGWHGTGKMFGIPGYFNRAWSMVRLINHVITAFSDLFGSLRNWCAVVNY